MLQDCCHFIVHNMYFRGSRGRRVLSVIIGTHHWKMSHWVNWFWDQSGHSSSMITKVKNPLTACSDCGRVHSECPLAQLLSAWLAQTALHVHFKPLYDGLILKAPTKLKMFTIERERGRESDDNIMKACDGVGNHILFGYSIVGQFEQQNHPTLDTHPSILTYFFVFIVLF